MKQDAAGGYDNSPHTGGGVERLGYRDERCPGSIEDIDDLGEVGEGAGQAVDFVDDDDIDLTRMDVGKELLEPQPIETAAREPAVIVRGRHQLPALGLLAEDVCLARSRCACGLLKSLAGVDGAAAPSLSRQHDQPIAY
jgi:hypothetical protein